MIINPDDTRVKADASQSGTNRGGVALLANALQLLALIIHPATVNAAAKFKKRELKSLEEKLYLPDSICIIDIFEAILYQNRTTTPEKHTGRGLSPHRMGALYCLLRS